MLQKISWTQFGGWVHDHGARSSTEGRQPWRWGSSWEFTFWSKVERMQIGMSWAFETSKPSFSDTTSTRHHLLILTKQFYQLRTQTFRQKPMGPFTFKSPQKNWHGTTKTTLSKKNKAIPKFAILNFKVYCRATVINQPCGTGTRADM